LNGDNYKFSSVIAGADAIHLVFTNDDIKRDEDVKSIEAFGKDYEPIKTPNQET
jgi:regulatory protein YycI of two-component signal transduction system YycFG